GLDVGRARDHRDHDVRPFGHSFRGRHDRRARLREGLRAIQGAIRDRDGKTRFDGVSRDRRAHDPEAHNSDALHHQFSISSSRERKTLRSPVSSETRNVPSSVTSTLTEATSSSSVTWMNPEDRASSFAIASASESSSYESTRSARAFFTSAKNASGSKRRSCARSTAVPRSSSPSWIS